MGSCNAGKLRRSDHPPIADIFATSVPATYLNHLVAMISLDIGDSCEAAV
jgi:hypothetical protein